jgi:hypothetical protein
MNIVVRAEGKICACRTHTSQLYAGNVARGECKFVLQLNKLPHAA